MGSECGPLFEIVSFEWHWSSKAFACQSSFTSIQNLYVVLGATYLDRADPVHVQISRIAAYVAFPRYDPWYTDACILFCFRHSFDLGEHLATATSLVTIMI